MKRIYVVEDHDAIRDGVVRYLEISGYEAVGMATVAEERKAIDENLPDLVIQDVMLPDGDGFLFVKELRSRGVDVPVIFMTARSEESDRILGFELGADDYISKPFSPKELVLRVGALFRRMEHGSVEARPEQRMSFSSGPDRLVIDIGAQFEFNFWGYGIGQGYEGYSRITPYMLVGAGVTIAPKPLQADAGFNMPVGVGVKFKVKPRWNIGFEWSMRFTTTDRLDVSNADGVILADPYGVKSGSFKNKDCYSFTMLSVTYDLFPKCVNCNNIKYVF